MCFGVTLIVIRVVSRGIEALSLQLHVNITEGLCHMHMAVSLRTQHSAAACKYVWSECRTKRRDGGCCSRQLHLLWKFGMSVLFSMIASILRKQWENIAGEEAAYISYAVHTHLIDAFALGDVNEISLIDPAAG